MFAFNKNNASPGSRQSSADSLVADPSPSTSSTVADTGASHYLDASLYRDQPSPAHSGRRASVFNLRSRSNTVTSTSSSFASLTSASMSGSDNSSRRMSQDVRPLPGQSFMELPGTRRSLFRGKKGKRLSGSFSPSFTLNEIEETDLGGKRASVLRKNRKATNELENPSSNLKNRISSPFDFKHLTHTDRHQFPGIHQTSENELAAEYWAVRASQAPRRDLTGIKADKLHFNNFSSEHLASSDPCIATASTSHSPPMSPSSSYEQQQSSQGGQERPPLRTSRSVESFSQPGVNLRMHRHTQSANPPPPGSSRLPLTSIHDDTEEPVDHQGKVRSISRSYRQSGIWDTFAPLSPTGAVGQLPTMAEESDVVGHALTTPDDSAIHTYTPPFSPGLDDVVEEEPERFIRPRPAPPPPIRSPKSPRSPFFESYSMNGQRSPIAKSHTRKVSHVSPKSSSQRNAITRPVSQMSDTLGSPGPFRKSSTRRAPSIRRKSNTWRAMEESWEDDIDYIYDNALEADCDFDWDQSSEDRERTPEQYDDKRTPAAIELDAASPPLENSPRTPSGFFSRARRPSLLVPSASNVPDLEARSAISASTADTVQTPSDFCNPLFSTSYPNDAPEAFNLTPSLLVPQDFKDEVSRENMYEDLLADYEDVDRHFPLLETIQSISSSTRSSHVRSSKRSSYDSSLMSSGQRSGSGSWTSGVRRSASSSGSLPELVHSSRHARRDFNTMVENLSEQVASLSSFGEDDAAEGEDDDITPPGHMMKDRTFFASDHEQLQTDDGLASVEVEVKASLELARQGSTRSTRVPPPNHRYASSDGTAKMFAALQPAPEPRHRAASASTTRTAKRNQYLNLFPAPPKH